MQIYLKPLRWYLFFNLVFGGISNVCTALLPYFTQEIGSGALSICLVWLLPGGVVLSGLQLYPDAFGLEAGNSLFHPS